MTAPHTRILIVDDEVPTGQILKAGLEMHGFAVKYESCSTSAIEACLDFHPALVMLDVDMPVKDGGQVAAELKSHPALRHIPILFLTSLVSRTEAAQHSAAGETFLSKPISIAKLVAAIRACLAACRT